MTVAILLRLDGGESGKKSSPQCNRVNETIMDKCQFTQRCEVLKQTFAALNTFDSFTDFVHRGHHL